MVESDRFPASYRTPLTRILTSREKSMASYKYGKYLLRYESDQFDKEFEPGSIPYNSGIYRCKNCGEEIAATEGVPLPAQHRHSNNLPIVWQLLVYAAPRD
jgi:hypothetical protein